MRLEPVSRQSLPDAVFDQLSSQIVGGELEPGTPLPPERELVRLLGVNRQAVREAVKRLAQAGLVETRHGGGTLVLDYRRNAGLNLLSRLLMRGDGNVDLRVARSVMEMRAALAPDIARLCAKRRGPGVGEQLESITNQMRQAGENLDRLQMLALEFWQVLVAGSDNVAYELAFNTLRGTYEEIRGALVQAFADELQDLDDHVAISKAVAKGDAKAAAKAAQRLVAKGTEAVLAIVELLESGTKPKKQ
jgi:DNA-binding FadR family transcriptional regulator